MAPAPNAPVPAGGLVRREVDYDPPPDQGLDLVHVDEAMVVVAKPPGLLSVPGRGEDRADCMALRVQQRFPDALIVHRLDQATSGLLVLGRGAHWQRALSLCFERRLVHKRYEALVHGLIEADEGEVNLPLITDWPQRPRQMVCLVRGKPSLTRYRVMRRDAGADQDRGRTRVSLEPVTGRSHQLRVHMLALGHPIVGDGLYGDDTDRATPRMMLHAAELALPHPETGVPLHFVSPTPF